VTDEKFWRDVAAQVVGTGTVALIVLVYAALAGHLDPEGSNAAFRTTIFIGGIALALMLVVGVFLTWSSAVEMQRREGRGAFWRYLIGVGVLMLLMLGIAGVPWLIAVITDAPLLSQ
jgi:hypothetical protein